MTEALLNDKLRRAGEADTREIFRPLPLGRLTLKNRLLRSSISGRIDNYDGSGTPARVHFEERFAKGGVAAIISSHVPITPRARVLPNYAMIDRDERIGFWRTVGQRVRAHDCLYILQLSHSGRQQDIGGVENEGRLPDGATDKPDYFNGLRSRRMAREEVPGVVRLFADAAERVVAAGLDGIELHSANGYLFTQFLSKAINDRPPGDYNGPRIEDRAQFLMEVIRAIQERPKVGRDFPLIVKVTGHDHHNAAGLWPWRSDGNDVRDAVTVAEMVRDAGAHAVHVSTGSMFPHPLNPAGPMPVDVARRTYQSVIASGRWTFRNYLGFRWFGWFVRWLWSRKQPFWVNGRIDPDKLEGFAAPDAKAINEALAARAIREKVPKIPVLLTGGFQTAHGIARVLREGCCDAVTIARPLLANPDLPRALEEGWDGPRHKPCSYCNNCLLRVVEGPLGCYDQERFDEGDPTPEGHDRMMRDVFAIFTDYTEPGPKRSAP
jgi:2,4-dienoyl-CoA reductase (NADPH2)